MYDLGSATRDFVRARSNERLSFMRHALPRAPQFYVTAPQPCPYLADRQERKLFTSLDDHGAQELNDGLSKQGFRRSQNVLYRPSCKDCAACMSARIRVADFQPSKSQKRVSKRNAGLTRHAKSPWATEEQFDLFRTYLDHRHASGGMADMDVFEFASMIEETPVKTRLLEYHDTGEDGETELIGTCLTDVLEDGLSMVYSFYHPDRQRDSLGTYVILDHIEIAKNAGLPYVYLGYWVPGSPKMDYKARFSGLELFRDGAWQPHDIAAPPPVTHPNTGTISEQVAEIELPICD